MKLILGVLIGIVVGSSVFIYGPVHKWYALRSEWIVKKETLQKKIAEDDQDYAAASRMIGLAGGEIAWGDDVVWPMCFMDGHLNLICTPYMSGLDSVFHILSKRHRYEQHQLDSLKQIEP